MIEVSDDLIERLGAWLDYGVIREVGAAPDLIEAASCLAALQQRVEELEAALRIVPGKVTVEDREWARDKIIDELEARERVLREALEWMDRKGGLGLDVHDRIRAALSAHKEDAP